MPSNSTASAPQQGRDKLHLQLARLFRSKVSTGAWPVGSAIPTVQELQALHGVSRTTVRMALGALVAEGLLLTRKRGGTRVIAAPYKPPSFLLPTSWKELVAFGAHIGQITLHTGRDCLPPIPEGFPDVGRMAPAYVHLLRVYDHDAARFCLSQLYLEQELFPEIEAQLQRSSLAVALSSDPSRIAVARQHLSVAPADELAAAGVDIQHFNHHDLAGVLRMVRVLGSLTGKTDAAERLAAALQATMDAASAEAAANADGSGRKVNAAAPPATSKVSTATSRMTLRRARRGFALGVVRAPVAALLVISPHLPQVVTILWPLGTKPPSSTGYLGVAHTSLFGVLHPFSTNGVSRCHFATLRTTGNSRLTGLAGAVTAWKVW